MKVFRKKALIFLVIVEILMLPLFSCSKGEEGKAQQPKSSTGSTEEITIAEKDEQIKEAEILTPVKQPEKIEGIITFYSGDVTVFEEGEWYEIEIGDFVTEKNVLKVESDSYCEVQFGNTAVVKIQENSEVNLAKVSLEPGNTAVSLDMKMGDVLCKVQKLTGNDSFKVKTKTAVCGVRGTEFSVSAAEGSDTVLAVKKGAVTVLPKSVDIDELREKVADKGDAVKEAIKKIEESAPVVKANEEIKVDTKVIEETKAAAAKIEKAVEEAAAAKTPEEEEKVAEKLNEVIEEQKEEVVKTVEKPKEISVEKAENLEQVEHMKMIAIAPAPAAEKADSKEKPAEPAIVLYKVSINSLTEGAAIEKDGRVLARNSYSGIFEEGELLKFHISKEGYEPYDMNFKVTKNTARLYKVELKKLSEPEKEIPKKEISFKTVPETADIFINGEKKGRGSLKDVFEEGTALSVKVSGEGYDDKLLEITIDENTEEIYEVVLQKGVKSIVIKTEPEDAVIMFQGKEAGTGNASFDFKYGDSASINISRKGYESRILKLNIDGNTKPSYSITLKAKPVELVMSPFKNSVIKEIAYQNGRFFAADKGGNIYSAQLDGKSSWKYATKNTQNANSAPVAAGNYIFMSGAREMVTLESVSGKLNMQKTLDQNSAHMFGRSIIPYQNSFIYPENKVLKIGSFTKGSSETEINLPSDSGMSPAVWNNNIVIADSEGTVHIIDPSSKQVTGSIKTSAFQPIAISITVSGNKGFFANRKGKVAAVDFSSKTLLWEKEIKEEKINIFSDLSVNKGKVFVFTGNKIHILNEADGTEALSPVRAASPPLCGKNLFYAGKTDGNFGIYNCTTGKEVKTLSLDYGIINVRPASAGDMIIAGTDRGKIIVLNPEGFEL